MFENREVQSACGSRWILRHLLWNTSTNFIRLAVKFEQDFSTSEQAYSLKALLSYIYTRWLTMADNLKGIPFSSDDEGIDFPSRAKQAVKTVHNEMGIGTPRRQKIQPLEDNEIYVVWFAFVRGNWKAILSTSRPDGRIYEVSYKRENDGSDGPEAPAVAPS